VKKVLYIFGRLSDEDIEWLITNGKKERFEAGVVLIREGEKIDWLYICLEGTLIVTVGGEKGKKVAELAAGEIVGEMSFVDSRPPSATVTAGQSSLVYSIRREELVRKIEGDDGFAARFYHAIAIFLADRLRASIALYGYGNIDSQLERAKESDELDEMIMDYVHLAGDRFHRMLTRMLESR
jgi:CRP-like cAMP-binding protein